MKRIIMATALLLATFTVAAQEADHARFRIGAAAAFSDYNGDPTFPVSDSALGLQLYAQAQVSSWFGAELGYYASGGFDWAGFDPNIASADCTTTDYCDTELSFNGFSLSAVGYLPIGGEDTDIDLYGKLGAYNFNIDITQTIAGSRVPGSLGRSTGVTLGAGAIINISDNWGVRTEFDYFDIENADLWTLAMGLEYRF
jgi:opacity protein-like surface antigen